jgi:cobalt/nickel transport system permease protein
MNFAIVALHIPDGFLSLRVSILCWLIAIPVLAIAIARTNDGLGERQVPLMGVMAAFIFAAQMLNFPVAGGTSGHLVGAALAAILLGPWPAMIIMTAVIAVQALLFQDGGLLAMGANLLNMGIVGVAIGYGISRIASHGSQRVRLVAAGGAAWLSIVAGAIATAVELWLSGTVRLEIVMPAMAGVHALIGLGEALITVGALTLVSATRPDLLKRGGEARGAGRGWTFIAGLLSLTAILLAPAASIDPDGLSRVAEDLGFAEAAVSRYAPLSGYDVPGFSWGAWGRVAAGMLGVAAAVSLVIVATQTRRRKS